MEGIGEVGSTFKFILKVILCTILMVLSHLSATKGLCRGTIECIEISVFLLKLLHCIIDELNDILSRLLSLRSLQILTTSKEDSKLIQGRDSKRCCHILGKLTYLIFRIKEAFIETSLTECHRIRASLSMLNHIIATLKEFSNLFKVHHKLFPEVTLRCLKDQREVERHSTNVASPNRHILVSLRIFPRSEVRPASHRMNHTLLIRRSVSFRHSAMRSINSQKIRVHALAGTFNSLLEHISVLITAMLFPIIEIHELREHNLFTPMSLHAGIKDSLTNHLKKRLVIITEIVAPLTKGKCSERKVASRTRNSIELQFKRLEALPKLTLEILYSHCTCFIELHIALVKVFLKRMVIRFLSIREERLVNLRDSESTELLCSSYKGDVTDHLKGTKDTRRLRIGNIGHTKATLKNSSHVKETTVD